LCLGQPAQPRGVLIVLGRILAMRVDQDIDVGQLHRRLAVVGVVRDVVVFNQARRLIDVLPGETTATSEGHELESILLLWRTRRPDEEADRLLDKTAHRRSRRGRPLFESLKQLLVERDCGAHDA
jgi:hypothetical protein